MSASTQFSYCGNLFPSRVIQGLPCLPHSLTRVLADHSSKLKESPLIRVPVNGGNAKSFATFQVLSVVFPKQVEGRVTTLCHLAKNLPSSSIDAKGEFQKPWSGQVGSP